MKDEHKLLVKYLLFIIWSPCFSLLFGFIFDKYLPDLVSLLILLLGFLIIHFAFTPESDGYTVKARLAELLLVSLFLGYGSFYLYEKINETTEEFTEQYNVEIVHYDLDIATTTVYFYNKEGEYCKAELGITKPWYTPEDYSPDHGDIILIDEYKGFFGNKYYRFVKIVEKGS